MKCKKTWKKLVSIALALMVATGFTLVSGTGDGSVTAYASVTNTDADHAIAVSEGETYEVVIDEDNSSLWYSFTPSETTMYTIYSSNGIDPKMFLYADNLDDTYIAFNDDGLDGHNFKLVRTLEADTTYYIEAVSCEASDTYNLQVEKTRYYVDTALQELEAHPGDTLTLSPEVFIRYTTTTSAEYAWYDVNGGVNLNCSNSSYSMTVSQSRDIYCEVKIIEDEEVVSTYSVGFLIRVDSGLEVDDEDKTYYVARNTSKTLSVEASVDVGALSYTWYHRDENAGEYTEISGATSSSYTTDAITSNQEYRCKVVDDYGNYEYVYFYIYIDSGFEVTCDTDGDYFFKYYVAANESKTLSVNASVNDGEQLTYTWYLDDEDDGYTRISEATSSSYTTGAITGNQRYRCIVADDYGNYENVYFYIYIDSGFEVTRDTDGDYEFEYNVAANESKTLSVNASVNDGEQLTYTWYLYDEDDGYIRISEATSASYTTGAITSNQEYRCKVADDYGKYEYVYFYISIDSGFEVTRDTDGDYGFVYYVAANESKTLSVNASVNDGEQLTYTWYLYDEDDGYIRISEATSASYTTGAITSNQEYLCTVVDAYGNYRNVYFYIYIDSGFEVTRDTDGDYEFEYNVAVNESKTLSVDASVNDGEQLTYTWYLYDEDNGYTRISGATSASYTTGAITSNQKYRCRVADAYGNEQKIYFYLYVLRGSGNVNYGYSSSNQLEGITMSVKLMASSGAITYQWYKYNSNTGYVKIDEATSASYTVATTKREEYRCRVKDAFGNVQYSYFELNNCSHSWGEGKITKAATTTQEGVMTYTCEKCNVTKTVKIAKLSVTSMNDVTVTGIKNMTYTGKAITLSLVVKKGARTLKKGTDYTVSYKNNKDVGTATVTITGKGEYSGTLAKNFKITKAKNPLTVTYTKKTYKQDRLKKTKTFSIGAKKAEGKLQYTLSKQAKKAKITVNTKGKVTLPKKCKKGTYKITVTAAGNHNYKKLTKTVKIIVK
ncbi:hypothetical protein [Eubacterium oxidoreducens]|uniref:Immunoglobulin domain-containing protein n=1 Tax=Eubacterium oxidoreducens TaxID=1732 RepID=A0A1G6AVS1_EUBOX|nr:hypothetical protein [Eubacterium oxidoreducens]SDB12506.1 hypothetical protein SAMN02910417_00951 [Eubacterium oxidoreducens]